MEGQNAARCHLLRLPQEIRDQIYSDILDLPALAPPICPNDAEDCIEEDQGWGCGYYSDTFPPISCLALLLSNRVIAAEVSEVIARRNKNKETALRYKLDLMIWDCDLQPTWLSLPVPLKYVRKVEVDVRIFRYEGIPWADYPSQLSQYLLQLLRRFLTNGPAFIKSHSELSMSHHRPPQLDSLTITFIPMLEQSFSSSSNYQVLNFPGQKLSVENFARTEINAYIHLSEYVKLIANSGLLFGKIKSLRLRYRPGGLMHVYDVKDRGDISLTEKLCSGHGWGPILEITQKMVDGGGIEYGDTLDCLPRSHTPRTERKWWGDPFYL